MVFWLQESVGRGEGHEAETLADVAGRMPYRGVSPMFSRRGWLARGAILDIFVLCSTRKRLVDLPQVMQGTV